VDTSLAGRRARLHVSGSTIVRTVVRAVLVPERSFPGARADRPSGRDHSDGKEPRGNLYPTWDILFPAARLGDKADTVYNLGSGHSYVFKTTKAVQRRDVFEFQTELAKIDNATAQTSLDMVRVVPIRMLPPLSLSCPGSRHHERARRTQDPIHASAGGFGDQNLHVARDHVITLSHSAAFRWNGVLEPETKENWTSPSGCTSMLSSRP